MASKGWIKLHRSLSEHWVSQDHDMFFYWIDLLLMVNHEAKKIPINKNLQIIEAGQKLTSYRKLAERWETSPKTVRKVLNAFENDNMITLESRFGGTLISVVNYGVYQGFKGTNGNAEGHAEGHAEGYTVGHAEGHADYPQTRMSKNGIKNDIKNEKEKDPAPPDNFSLPVMGKFIMED